MLKRQRPCLLAWRHTSSQPSPAVCHTSGICLYSSGVDALAGCGVLAGWHFFQFFENVVEWRWSWVAEHVCASAGPWVQSPAPTSNSESAPLSPTCGQPCPCSSDHRMSFVATLNVSSLSLGFEQFDSNVTWFSLFYVISACSSLTF
jgi:hypothetical protein